jgi:hypothetical protein
VREHRLSFWKGLFWALAIYLAIGLVIGGLHWLILNT